MIKPSRRNVTPVIVRNALSENNQVEPLERIPWKEKAVSEDWLQRLIYHNPALLAVEEIEPDYGPLIPLGREVSTAAGPIDALFVSPTGLITLVEAKLWMNPQARREVVGQILDYAQHLAEWSYEELDERARKSGGRGLWEAVVDAVGDEHLAEDEFVDAVTRNLTRGSFLLLIVGDGIRDRVEDLATYLQQRPDMRFTLAMLELGLYRGNSDGDLLVVPTLIARTREIVRQVIEIREGNGDTVRLLNDAPNTQPTRPQGNARVREPLDDDLFFTNVREKAGPRAESWMRTFLDGARLRDVWVDATAANRIVKVRDPGESGKDLTLVGLSKGGRLWVGSIAGQMRNAGQTFDDSAAQRLLQRLAEMFDKTLVKTDMYSPAPDTWHPDAELADSSVTPEQVLAELDAYLAAANKEAEGQETAPAA